jgi:hypothetical protein
MNYSYEIESNTIIENGEIQIRWLFKELQNKSPTLKKFGKFYSGTTIESFNRTQEFFLNHVVKDYPELLI